MVATCGAKLSLANKLGHNRKDTKLVAKDFRRYVGVKYINLLTGVIFGFLQIYVFAHTLSLEDTAFVLTIYGLFYYFTFLDLGLTKPFYATIRDHFINDQFRKKDFWPEVCISILLTLVVFGIFLTVALFFAWVMQTTIGMIPIVIISFVFSMNFGFSFLRPFFDAIDQFFQFEKVDLFRRFGMIFSLYLATLDPTLYAHSIGLLATSSIAYLLLLKKLHAIYGTKNHRYNVQFLKRVFHRLAFYWTDAVRYLNFTISETLINNIGLVMFPLYFTASDVIFYSIWIRLYRGAAMFPRTLFDVRLHGISRYYFSNKTDKALHRLYRSILFGSLMAAIIGAFTFVFGDYVVNILSDEAVQLSKIAWFCLVMILITNVFQHSSGTFLLSTGKHFAFCQKTANYVMVFGGLAIILPSIISRNVDGFFLLYASTFLISAFVYHRKAISVLRLSK